MSIVKINVLTVPAEQREVLEQRFASRAGAVENSDGFEWFELLRPIEGTDDYLVYTRWRDEESFKAWMEGPMKAAHQGGGGGGAAQARVQQRRCVVVRGRAAGRAQELGAGRRPSRVGEKDIVDSRGKRGSRGPGKKRYRSAAAS